MAEIRVFRDFPHYNDSVLILADNPKGYPPYKQPAKKLLAAVKKNPRNVVVKYSNSLVEKANSVVEKYDIKSMFGNDVIHGKKLAEFMYNIVVNKGEFPTDIAALGTLAILAELSFWKIISFGLLDYRRSFIFSMRSYIDRMSLSTTSDIRSFYVTYLIYTRNVYTVLFGTNISKIKDKFRDAFTPYVKEKIGDTMYLECISLSGMKLLVDGG